MSAELSPDRDAVVDQLVTGGLFPSRRDALDHAVDLLREEAETVAAIQEGLASIERGEGEPLADVFRDLREKYGRNSGA